MKDNNGSSCPGKFNLWLRGRASSGMGVGDCNHYHASDLNLLPTNLEFRRRQQDVRPVHTATYRMDVITRWFSPKPLQAAEAAAAPRTETINPDQLSKDKRPRIRAAAVCFCMNSPCEWGQYFSFKCSMSRGLWYVNLKRFDFSTFTASL